MKIKTSQISIRKIGLIVPVLAYFLINGVFTMLTTLSARIFSLQSFASSVGQTIPYLSIFTVTCSYLSCHLYTKKKVWGYYGFILSFAFISLFYYLKSDNDYGIMLWVISYFLYSSVTGILLYILYDWFQKKEKQKELKRQNLQSELNLLKNQLNPHFLFNTLNNIDSLICSYPEKASKSLVQMSEMMRYMIYETNTPEVDLAQELKYIHNYLDLQQLQYDNPNLVSYRLEGSPDNIRVAPMLFIAFIENAFKHCTDKKAPEAIRLFFQIQKSEIHFEIFNMFDPAKQINKDSSSGIGLNIIRRRLDILYRRRYDLQTNQKNGYFDVSLTIKLT